MKRNKILALIGAGVLTLGVAGVALATDLNPGQVGIKLSDKEGTTEECADFPLEIGAGEVGVHFVLTGADADSGLLDATFSTDSFSGLASSKSAGGTVHWYAVITGDGDTTLDSAFTTNVDGDLLNLSHACFGETITTTTFESSVESSTTSVETSSTTSFQSSEESTTVTQPPTDTIGQASGQQSSGLWMLLAALGVLAGSVIVLAPSKAKSKN